jgi:hypothetical protein
VQSVVDLALGPPPGEATHWTGRMLAVAAGGVNLRSVQRILKAHQLAPYRIRTFKLSNDPNFAEKLKTSRASTSILPPMRSSSRSTEPNPGTRPYRAGFADEARPCRILTQRGWTLQFAADDGAVEDIDGCK